MTEELPEGWAVAALADISAINPRHDKTIDDETMVTFVPMAAISEDSPDFLFREERPLGNVRKGFTHFADGDVLFAKITPCMENGKGAVAQQLRNGLGCGTTEVHVIRPASGVGPLYLYRYLSQISARRLAKENFTGTAGQLRVPTEFIKTLCIPIPPSAEQRRIEEKLEKLLAEVERCKERMAKIPVLLKRFRQSVLAAACSGRLTADWRESNTDDTNGPEYLLRQIRERRLKSASSKRRETIDELYSTIEESDSDALPLGWSFTFLNKLAKSFDYGTSSKSAKEGRVPVLRMGNIQGGRIDWNDLVYTSDAEEVEKYTLAPHTVLFNRTNSPELVGKTAIYRGERPAIFAGYLIRINTVPELDPEYLNLCLNSPAAREFCLQVKTDGVSQSNINAQKLGTFEIPFCSLAEQKEIVQRAAKLLELADRIEERYQGAKKRVDSLMQSILAKAFRGELVPTEAELAAREGRSYESASQLLQRILASKNENETGGWKRAGQKRRAV